MLCFCSCNCRTGNHFIAISLNQSLYGVSMMKKIKIMFILLLSCSLNMIGMEEKTILPTYDQQAAGKEAFPPKSQDKLLQWKEAVDNEVMKFVESLPEDEQAQFWKDVEEME